MTTATLIDGVLCWRSEIAVDADGSPVAYHADSKSGLDRLANALHIVSEYETHVKLGQKPPHGWAGVATVGGDEFADPIVQGETPPPIVLPGGVGYLPHRPHAPGFYVSTTSFTDKRFPVGDPCRYLDSTIVRYVTYTGRLLRMGASPGDLVVVAGPKLWCTAVLGDYGPDLGEGSIATCLALGGPADPRHGGPAGTFAFAVFTGSSGPWPRGEDEIASQIAVRFAPWGGLERLRKVG